MFDKTGRGIITWRELSSLMKALGIPDIPLGLLNRMAASHTPENSMGLEYKSFLHLLHSEPFSATLDYTYNRHNSTYNIRVIKKALSLLIDGFLTLEDLQASRMGFTLYEGETCNGIQLEAASVSAAMRVTGKAIAPRKLVAWLDGIEEDVPGRLQLYEFLDLVKLCNDRTEETKAVPTVTTTVDRSRAGLFELTDATFLLTPNQKLEKHMNEDYDNTVNLINSQQIPPRETLASAKKSASSHDFSKYSLNTKQNKAVEDGLEFYGQLRESIKSSSTHVQAARAIRSSSRATSTRPQSVCLLDRDRNARLPTLRLLSAGPRSASAPSMRSIDSQKSTRTSDLESTYDGPREVVPRHLTASAPLMRGFGKDKYENGLDDGEHGLPERRLENYETLRGYIAANGEASLSRIVTSSIGASHKLHMSPPPSPHLGKAEERKKRPKPKRAFEEPKKLTKPIYKDHRFSMDSLANNLEDIINGTSRPHTADLTKALSVKRPSSSAATNEDSDNDNPPNPGLTSSVAPEPAQSRPRTRNANETPVRNITFNLTSIGD
eukprot:Phypoly_transcript_03681.p1 GENE.Phypoly_transcript_03681~~Phypoly_transcript_03681.p1  ORF type:complete len:550 (-),score=63.81 Phypoly_transcript_03681:737-2386(-)